MIPPLVSKVTFKGRTYVQCDAPRRYVVEHAFWSAGGPISSADALQIAREAVPTFSYPNFSDRVRELVERGRLVKLQSKLYIHRQVLDLLS